MPANVCLDKDRESLCEGKVDIYRSSPFPQSGNDLPPLAVQLALLPFVSLSLLHSIALPSQTPLPFLPRRTFIRLRPFPSL